MNKSKSTERPGRKKLTDKQPATKGYAPIDHRWYERPRDLPPFTFRTIRDMLLEPTIRLGLKMRAAPLCGIEFAYKKPGSDEYTPGIQADNPLVAAFVERQLKRIWNDITHLLDAQIWGWAAAELMFRMIDSTAAGRCFLEIDRLLPRHAVDVRILVQDGEPKAVRFMRIKEQPQGHVDVEFPKAVFHTHAPEPGQHYGTSILTGAHSPWADKWLNGGALDVRRLFMTKDAYRGAKLWYPNEIYEIEGKGPVPARDIAREIVEQAKAGAIVTLPSGDYPNGGSKKWDWEESSTNSNPQHILQYPKDLDTEMLRGMEVPDDIFTAEADTSGSWGGKKVPLAAFYGGLDIWATKLLRDLKEQIVDRLVKYNFGPGHWYEIKHKPLADQAMENQAKSGPGGGGNPFQPQRPPQFGGFGRNGDGDGEHGESGNGFPKRMGLDGHGVDPVEAVGRGVLGAAELVEAAGRVIRMRTGGDDGGGKAKSSGQRWITIGGRKRGDKEHSGGFPVLIDGEGRILGGGPKGLRGKHVSKVGEYFDQDRAAREKSKEDKFADVSGFFDQIAAKGSEERKAADEEHARSAPGNTRSWKKIVAHQAANWDMSPEAYESIADDVWKSSLAMHEDRESAKKYAREQLRLTAADVSRLENQGLDYGSEHKRIKGLDALGRELAALYPGLGWGEGWGDSERDDYDELVWELIKEGRQAAPSRTSREFHDAIDNYLEGEMRRFGDSWKRPEEVSEEAWQAFSLWRMGQRSLWDEDEHPRDDDGKFVEKEAGPGYGADAPKHKQEPLFAKTGKPGQGNLFADKGVPDDMVLKPSKPSGRVSVRNAASSGKMVSSTLDDNAGFIHAMHRGNTLTITSVEIDESLRGKGIGKSLYLDMVNYAKENGLEIESDKTVEAGAVRVWKSLAKDHPVETHPQISFTEDGDAFVPGMKESPFRLKLETSEEKEDITLKSKFTGNKKLPTEVSLSSLKSIAQKTYGKKFAGVVVRTYGGGSQVEVLRYKDGYHGREAVREQVYRIEDDQVDQAKKILAK